MSTLPAGASPVSTPLSNALAERYRIARELGQGGMATVYLARDLKHERDVAIKVLHPDLGAALGAERFLTEIRTTARLQHPHILPLLDSGDAGGTLFYVMPFVAGETLRARLQRERQLPIGDAVSIAREVADALGYAHSLGVIHRDIKPENILLQGGHALVADFGIALAVQSAGDARLTRTGLSLGTPQYMSPEQATGDRVIDARSDIYALGAVVYEMLIGAPPFSGVTMHAVIAKVMTERPAALSVERDTVPASVERAVLKALAKLPADRHASARDFSHALGEHGDQPALGGRSSVRDRLATRVFRSPIWAGAFIVAAGTAAWLFGKRDSETAGDTVRFQLLSATSREEPGSFFAFSADGRRLGYTARDRDSVTRIYIRALDAIEARPLAGTEHANFFAFSPDDEWLAYFADNELRKIRLAGGAPLRLARVDNQVQASVCWASRDRLVVSYRGRLFTLAATGGELRPIHRSDSSVAGGEVLPRVLPDGKTVLYTRNRGTGARIEAVSLESGVVTDLHLSGGEVIGVLDGRLIYGAPTGAITAIGFDDRRIATIGEPISLIQEVKQSGGSLVLAAAVSRFGTLVYQTSTRRDQLVTSDGRTITPIMSERGAYNDPRFSPDGKRVAFTRANGGSRDIWIYDTERKALQRLTTDGTSDRPEWTPDGTRVLFRSTQNSTRELRWQRVDGGASERLLNVPGREVWQGVLTPDGKTVIYRTGAMDNADLWFQRIDGGDSPHPLATSSFAEDQPRISPDGRWVTYVSNESGMSQVFVAPFPAGTPRQVVATGSVGVPVWSPDGRRLFYRDGQALVAATLGTGKGFSVVRRDTVLGKVGIAPGGHANYDISHDGRRILFVSYAQEQGEIIVAYNWLHELRALTAAGQGKARSP